MTKTIEDELAAPFASLDKALERIAKIYTKFIHGMSAEQRLAVALQLRTRVGTTIEDMERAERKATPFSLSSLPSSAPSASVAPRGHERFVEQDQGVFRPAFEPPIRQQPFDAREAPRPIGRIANDAKEPGAGEIVVAAPIKSPILGRSGEDNGVGFLRPSDKGDVIV